jgi:hypothetical protein
MKKVILLTLEYADDYKFDENIFIKIVCDAMKNGITIGMREVVEEEENGGL